MVSIDPLTMSFGAYVAVQDADLSVSDGEFLAIVGPTVCGKSTILNAIGGLLKPASGIVSIDGQPVRAERHRLLVPGCISSVEDRDQNVELGPMFKGVGAAERRKRSMRWLAKVGLKGFEHRTPHQLSGGANGAVPDYRAPGFRKIENNPRDQFDLY
ncbi:ATP-binding cassette domain-containing protein [Rhizobium sp. CNPSo 3490]|uniref:ATP-binding cassette domain-containing protein n=1 Tax=Rhizobium sp. CNPSo 3490 TaxID=3021407 RepID=UPI00254D3DB4|nr:ATP-binding cassette domain-containing protein [Rhizobium sp. CNPSo 3490]MDK4735181.1 ATP-binding cassette domain-containing protein [Rhizobium sp. CNPSo 3490]